MFILRALTSDVSRLSAEDSRTLPIKALYDGKEGVETVLAQYPQLDYAKEKDTFTRTLHGAIEHEFGTCPEDVKYVMELGADVNKPDASNSNMLPLGRACARAKETAVCKELISGGALVDGVDADGKTPIIHALDTDRKSEEKIALLVDNGLDINSRKQGQLTTPLGYAARLGNVKKGEILVQHGAETRITEDANSPGNIALREAVQNSNFNFAYYLLRNEPNTEKASNTKLNPFLHQAAGAKAKPLSKEEQSKTTEDDSKTAILDLLLSKGADIEGKDEKGHAPIARAYGGAYTQSDLNTIKWLKARGAQEAPEEVLNPFGNIPFSSLRP